MRRRTARGLTLLELLVASALLAVFFASVYGLVEGTVETRNAIEDNATPFAVGPAVLDRVVEDLRGANVEPYKDLDAFHAQNESVGSETCTRIDFVTSTPSRARVKIQNEWVKARLNEVGYRCRRSETLQGAVALYRREDLGVDEEPLAGGNYFKLADRVKTFRIDWYAQDPGDPDNADDGKGEEEWDAKKEKKLPYACRVTLEVFADVATDDAGRALGEAEVYSFVTYIAFNSRFDKADQQKP